MPAPAHPAATTRLLEAWSPGRSQSFHDSASRFLRAPAARCDGQHAAATLIYIVHLCNYGNMTPPEATEDVAVADLRAPPRDRTVPPPARGGALGGDLLAVVARLNRLATQRARMPLSFAQARLLSTIEDQGAAHISDLAALDHGSQPTMTTQVRRLEGAGLVSRTVDPGDARAVLIRITPKGVKTLTPARLDRGAAVDPYLDRRDADDRQTLADAVRVLRGLLEDAVAPKPTIK